MRSATPPVVPEPLVYQPSDLGSDSARYDVSRPNWFAGDPVATATIGNLAELASSPRWEDRVRAEVLRREVRVTLPEQFPCIYETVDSPHRADVLNPRPHAWVVSPDIDMLAEVLDDYQELWDSYTSQWGPKSRRLFAVGRLDGLSPAGVYAPGTTPAEVIGTTMLIHTDMYRRAPERLRVMHPAHERWEAARLERIAAVSA